MKPSTILLSLSLTLLLAACASDTPKSEDTPPVAAADETPAPGSQAEADAVAEQAAQEPPVESAEAATGEATPADETGTAEPAAESTAESADEAAPATRTKKPAADSGEPQTHATVSAVLPPAWIYRGALSTALLPGTAVYQGDRIETGADGRVQFMLDDGGLLQLGGGSKLTVTQLLANETSSLDGTLDFATGSYAYQSGHNGSLLPGDLDFRMGKLTAFLTQAALMGRIEGKQSLLCLLSGRAEVSNSGQDPVTLDKPKACVSTSKTASPAAGTAALLKTLETSTQPPAGLKAMKSKGTWTLVLVSEGSEATAKKTAAKLWKSGYPAEVIEARVKGKAYYRVALRGFDSREAARSLKPRAAALGYGKAWVNAK